MMFVSISAYSSSLDGNAEPFNEFLERFIAAFNEKNSAEIDKCINTEFGFFVLDNPGAFVIAEHFKSFDVQQNIAVDEIHNLILVGFQFKRAKCR